jgi:hypothetical protein
MNMQKTITITPSRVEGVEGVERVSLFPDRLELIGGGGRRTILFRDIAKPQEPRWWSTIKKLFGRVPWPQLVADRDWFHKPRDRFFVFYTDPKIKIYMPVDEVEDHSESCFSRMQDVIRTGGYATFDLG